MLRGQSNRDTYAMFHGTSNKKSNVELMCIYNVFVNIVRYIIKGRHWSSDLGGLVVNTDYFRRSLVGIPVGLTLLSWF